MKKLIILILVLFPLTLRAQVGLKGGINFANITKVSSINNTSNTGYAFGLFMAPKPRGLFGFQSEIDFSRQGYSFDTNTNTGNVNLDYLLLPQLSTINITRFIQIQIGAQVAYLLNAKASESNTGSGNYDKLVNYYNRFDYGLAGGLEIHPFKGLLVGGRYNLSLGNMYKNLQTSSPGTVPSFIPSINVKNNVLNLYVGWHFIKSETHKRNG
jgi:hypothetical protein